jgi:hypothetical protein
MIELKDNRGKIILHLLQKQKIPASNRPGFFNHEKKFYCLTILNISEPLILLTFT